MERFGWTWMDVRRTPEEVMLAALAYSQLSDEQEAKQHGNAR